MRELPKDDSGDEFIQFRGRQTSVVLDDFGIRFETEVKETPDGVPNFRAHKPLPVAEADAIRAGEAPDEAVAKEVAEQITDGDLANPLICRGVVCEFPHEDGGICGQVFDTPESLNGHMSTHYQKQGAGDSSEADADTDAGDDA